MIDKRQRLGLIGRVFCGVDQMKRWIAIFAVIISWQILPENGHSQGTQNAGVNTENANEAGNDKPFSIPVRILEAPLSEPDHEQDREQRRRQEAREEENLATQKSIAEVSEKLSHYTLYQLWLSIASAFGLTLTVIFAGLAWRESKAATAEATRTADAAWKQLELTEDTRRKELRPYLALNDISSGAQKDGRIVTAVVLLNSGQTPAFIKHIKHSIITYLVADADPDRRMVSTDTTLVVGPNCHHTLTSETRIEPHLVPQFSHEMRTGVRQMYVHVQVKYSDIFGEEHMTVFTRTSQMIDGKENYMSELSVPDVAS